MQTVFRARSLADANSARDVLVASGIPAHVADQSHWDTIGELPGANVIRVLVDNRGLDHARRVVAAWKKNTGTI
jgi:hypothetical protein